jgi:hypothetical protein
MSETTAGNLVAGIFGLQISLVAGALLFRVICPFTRPRFWTKVARVVLFASIAAGLVGVGTNWGRSAPRPERIPSFARRVGTRAVFARLPSTPSRDEVAVTQIAARNSGPMIATLSVNDTFLGLYLILNLFFLALAVHEANRLRRVLRQAPRLRSLGKITLVTLEKIATPFSFSLFRQSWVAIPERMLDEPADLRIAIAHEIEHIRARHTRAIVLAEFFGAFAIPAAKLWKSVFTELHELSCDESVLGRARISPHEYASCLIRVAETALGEGVVHAGTACMASISGNPKRLKSFLRRRMEMLTEYGKTPAHSRTTRILGTLTIFASAGLAFSAGAILKPAEIPPVNGGQATFDPTFQKIAETQLETAIENDRAGAGIAIIANPQTGEILASVYLRSKEYAKSHPESASASARLIEPASTMKGIVLASALESGAVGVADPIDCGGGTYQIGSHVHHDWKDFGKISAADVIVNSSNIGGIRIAEKLGGIGLEKSLENFGFGSGSSVKNFPGARPGTIRPKTDDPEWIAEASTGFAVHVNPLELVQAYSAIANGGNLLKPVVAGSSPELLRRVLSETNSRKMREVLARAAREGTGAGRGESLFYTSGGKTGTNYNPELKEHDAAFGGEESVAHYVGFAPLENPRVTVYVAIIDPKNITVTGGRHAAPVFKEIMERALLAMHVKPDQIAAQ